MIRPIFRPGSVAVLLLVAAATLAPDAQAQDPVLQHVAEVHIKPGMLPVFEAAHAVRNDRLARGGVSFPVRSAVSESLVYRFVSPVGDWAGLGQRAEEVGGMPAAPAGSPNGNSAIDHVDSYLRWTQPELNYQPENPRLQAADWEAMQLVRIYVQQGEMGGVLDVLRDAAALYKRHNVRDGYLVYTRGIGAGGPMVEIQFFGSSVTDMYQASEQLESRLGAEMDEIRVRLGALARSIEIHNFDIRRDMNYTPTN